LIKLPRTAEVIKENIESRETYAIRRVQWTAMSCRQKGIYPERWQLIKQAGVERIAQFPLVKEAIDVAMRTLHGIETQMS
jgi:hypothetical protein